MVTPEAVVRRRRGREVRRHAHALLVRLPAAGAERTAGGRVRGRGHRAHHHELLYAPLGNALVPQLLGAFWTVFSRVAGIRGWTDDPSPELTVRRHRDIVTALRARDVEAAQRAMADHFRGIEARAAQESRGVG
ncbi:FCD domain-containing protein [Streptomyces sp. NBC_00268]|nr:FCD domain-containing protein [Streptomyces sp. NBC_00268]